MPGERPVVPGPQLPHARSSEASGAPRTAVDIAGVLDRVADAVIVVDARGAVVMANHAAAAMVGVAAGDLMGRHLTELMPQRYRAAHLAGFARYLRTGRGTLVDGPSVRVAVLRDDGTELDVDLLLSVVGRPGDPGFAVVATIRDARETVVLQHQVGQFQLLQASIEASPDGVLAVSPQRRVLAVNRRFTEMWGLAPESVAVGDMSPLASARCLDQVVDPGALRAHINEGSTEPARRFEADIPLLGGRTFVAIGAPLLDDEGELLGRVWYLSDDTQRREAEAVREELLERLRTAQRGQTFLLQAIDVIGRASSYVETLERLAAISVPALADLCLIDVLSADGELVRMTARHADPAKRGLTDELARSYAPAGASSHPSAAAVATMESRWSPDMSEEFLRETTWDERHLELVTELGFESYMAVPLVDQGRPLGCVTLVSAGSGRHFGATDLALAENLAARVAQVVARARRYDLEHLASHALQSSLLPPSPPTIAGLSVASRYLPGTTDAEVGGDFHDVVLLDSGAVALALGDVMGHDLTAAATMGQLRSAFRVLLELTEGPASLITQLQSSWRMLGLSRFATAAFARLDPVTGQLRVASAGHPPPLLIADGRAEFLEVEPGSPLGVPPASGAEWLGELPVGGTLLFFSDGLVEDRRHDIDTGLERLRRVALDAGTGDPELLCAAAIDELVPADRSDDVAMLAVTRRQGTT